MIVFLLSIIAASVLSVAIVAVLGLFTRPRAARLDWPPTMPSAGPVPRARQLPPVKASSPGPLPQPSFTPHEPAPTGVLPTRLILRAEPGRQTYKRMVGRRLIEFDAMTHEPVDPDQTRLYPRISDV